MNDQVYQLGVADLDDLIALEKLCFDYHWTREQFLMGLDKGIYKVLGIRCEGRLGAYLAISFIGDEMEILNLAVHPDYRRQGLANQLMQTMFIVCRRSGITKSFLDVKRSNTPAISLYEKFGYRRIGVRKAYYPDTKEDALIYRHDFRQES